MIKISRQKTLLSSVLFIFLLISTTCVSLVPFVHAAKPNIQDKPFSELTFSEKTTTVLNDVVGFDITKYELKLDSKSQNLYFDVLPQEEMKCTLDSNESKVEVICTYVNEKLRSMNVYTNETPYLTRQSGNMLETAKEFISKYRAIAGTTYYETLLHMLNNVEANKNSTKTSENVKLEVTSTSVRTSFRWTYSLNDVDAPLKCVALSFENGFLRSFVDTWSLFTIGSTEINISEEKAVNLARDRANYFSWNVNMGEEPSIAVTEFTIAGVSETKLTFNNYATKNESRNGNPLTFYPTWRVKLYFDRLYQGKVYGVDVGLWADTGEIYDIRTLKFLGDYSTNDEVNDKGDAIERELNENNGKAGASILAIIFAALLTSAASGSIMVYYGRGKKMSRKLKDLQKSCSKLGGVLLCLLVSLAILSMSMQTVKGTYVMPLYGCTYETESNEVEAAADVVDVWEDFFGDYAGYTCYDYFGSSTQKQTVLDNADSFEDNYDHVALFHYGHAGMNGVFRDYFDDDGWTDPDDCIWDYEIYSETSSSKHFFVVLWSCRQGDYIGGTYMGTPYGMPYAWFHGPPSSGDCFIGFEDASMPLTQISTHNANCDYELWIMSVGMQLAYNDDCSVIEALDAASQYWFSRDYVETELDDGYTAYWDYGTWTGKMKVYGNWDIEVY